jgi:hypothetical protein
MKITTIIATTAMLATTSITAIASSADHTKLIRQLAAHEEFEVGYFLGKSKTPYVLHKGTQIDIDKAINLYKSKKEAERLSLIKEHEDYIAAKKMEEARIEAETKAEEMMSFIKGALISQASKHGITIINLDELKNIDTPFSHLSELELYQISDSYLLRVSTVTENGSSLYHLADLPLSGEVSQAVYGKDQFDDNKVVKFSAMFDFENSNLKDFTINVDHTGLWVMKDIQNPNYTQRLYALNSNLPKEKSTLNLSPGEAVEITSVERNSIIYSLIKK